MYTQSTLEDFIQLKDCNLCNSCKDCLGVIHAIKNYRLNLGDISEKTGLKKSRLRRLLKCLGNHKHVLTTKRPMYDHEFEEAVIRKLKQKGEWKKLEYFIDKYKGDYDEIVGYARTPIKNGKYVTPKINVYTLTDKGTAFWSNIKS